MAASSGSTNFTLPLHELLIESYSRIQIRGAALILEHVIEARRSMNLILQEWSGARAGPPLWAVDLVSIPMIPGISTYRLPPDTITILDAYRRQFQPGAMSSVINIGTPLVALVDGSGKPLLAADGEPLVVAQSGTFTAAAGGGSVTMNWPSHGQAVGNPIFFICPATIGTASLPGNQLVGGQIIGSAGTNFVIVNSVIDANNLTFQLPTGVSSSATVAGGGGTPLFTTTSGSSSVTVIFASHGLSAGSTFNVQIPTTVGGITFSGNYPVASVQSLYEFTITSGALATATTCGFENGGQIQLVGQQTGIGPIDFIMTPLSRTEYASLPDKGSQGLPTVFWLDRTIQPTVSFWQVPPVGQAFAFQFYRWRQLQDANPISGQIADLPNRWLPCFAAHLTAALAEKYRPDLLAAKTALAEKAWERAAEEDVEDVPLYIVPNLVGYYL